VGAAPKPRKGKSCSKEAKRQTCLHHSIFHPKNEYYNKEQQSLNLTVLDQSNLTSLEDSYDFILVLDGRELKGSIEEAIEFKRFVEGIRALA